MASAAVREVVGPVDTSLVEDLLWRRRNGDADVPIPRALALLQSEGSNASALRERGLSSFPCTTRLWRIRQQAELGRIELPQIEVEPLPETATWKARVVFAGFRLVVACRWYDKPGKAAPFSERFAAVWCGLSRTQARRAITELRDLGAMVEVERLDKPGGPKFNKTRLWLPRGVA
jgi:hypothetical protein